MEGKLLRKDAWAFAGNVATSVLIVFVNKQLLVSGFAYATTLCAFHFLACAISTWTSQALGLTTAAHIPRADRLRFAVVASLSIASLNLSLLVNSVGCYQVAKLLIIPCVCAMEAVLYNKQVTVPVAASIATVVVGVAIVTVTDIDLNSLGLAIAAVSVITSGLQQIMCSTLQCKYALSSHQLLSNTALVQGLMLVAVGPLIDLAVSSKWIGDYTWTLPAAQQLAVSCFLAVLVNVSQFMCLGRFSAVSFQVLGHTKTILVLLVSWWVFGESMTPRKLSGMALAVAGMVMYGWAAKQQNTTRAGASTSVGSTAQQEDQQAAVAAASSAFFGLLRRKKRLGLVGETLAVSEDDGTNASAKLCSRRQAAASAAAAFFALLRRRRALGLYGETLVPANGESPRCTAKPGLRVAGDAPATFFALLRRKRFLGLHRSRLGLFGEIMISRGESCGSEAASGGACSPLELTNSSDEEDIFKVVKPADKLSQAPRRRYGKSGRDRQQQQSALQGVVAAVSVPASATSKSLS
eukprot:gene7870-8066_t